MGKRTVTLQLSCGVRTETLSHIGGGDPVDLTPKVEYRQGSPVRLRGRRRRCR